MKYMDFDARMKRLAKYLSDKFESSSCCAAIDLDSDLTISRKGRVSVLGGDMLLSFEKDRLSYDEYYIDSEEVLDLVLKRVEESVSKDVRRTATRKYIADLTRHVPA